MPSKTLFLFFFVALVAFTLLSPFLLSAEPLEVPAILTRLRDTVTSSRYGEAIAPLVSPPLALYARLCGTLLSGGSAGERLYTYRSCLGRLHDNPDLAYPTGNPRSLVWEAFCGGVGNGLQLPGMESRTPLPRATVSRLLSVIVGLCTLPLLPVLATKTYRALARFTLLLSVIALTSFDIAVSVIREFLYNLYRSVEYLAPFLFQLTFVLVTCSVVALHAVLVWAGSFVGPALERLVGALDRLAAESHYANRSSQTPADMTGICSNKASACRETLRRLHELEDVLDAEREQHKVALIKAERQVRERDAEIRRLRQLVAGQGKELLAAKEEKAKLGLDLTAAQTIDTLRGEMASANLKISGLEQQVSDVQDEAAKKKSKFLREKESLREQISELEAVKPTMEWFLNEGITYFMRVAPTLTKDARDVPLVSLRYRAMRLCDVLVKHLPDGKWIAKPRRGALTSAAVAEAGRQPEGNPEGLPEVKPTGGSEEGGPSDGKPTGSRKGKGVVKSKGKPTGKPPGKPSGQP